MYELKSIDTYTIAGRGTVFCVASPVAAERSFKDFMGALGPWARIDGIKYEVVGVEWNLPNAPVRIGELIGLLVRE